MKLKLQKGGDIVNAGVKRVLLMIITFILIVSWILVGLAVSYKSDHTPSSVESGDGGPDTVTGEEAIDYTSPERVISGDPYNALQDLFCNPSDPDEEVELPSPVEEQPTCEEDEYENRCSSYSIHDLQDLLGITLEDEDNFCNPDHIYKNSNTWCDNKQWSVTDITTNPINLRNYLLRNCCEEVIDTSGIDYTTLLIYIGSTSWIVYIIINKLSDNITKLKGQHSSSGEFKKFFEWIGSFNFLIGSILIFLYIFLPALRWFLISLSCDIPGARGDMCGNPCSTQEDCVSLHGGCGFCINNICDDPSGFEEGGGDFHLDKIHLTICPENLLDGDGPQSAKFLHGQQIHVNDTLATAPAEDTEVHTGGPFVSRLPLPDGLDINDNKFNNFIKLGNYGDDPTTDFVETDFDPGDLNSSGGGCSDGTRKNLPPIDGPLEQQNLQHEGDLHNKVYREGPVSGENAWPCTNIVISNANKSILKNKLENDITNMSIMGDSFFHRTWVNEFELNRIECADQGGQCYMKDYPCETAHGTPIPLQYIESGLDGLTIGELSGEGCQKAVYPCSSDGDDLPCTILKLDDDGNGYLIEGQEGGTCKQVEWVSRSWVESPDGEYKCIPNTLIDSGTINTAGHTLEGAQVADWVSTAPAGSDITSQCMHVGRFPSNDVSEGEEINGDQVIFKWYAEPGGDYSLCNGSVPITCDPGHSLKTGLHTYSDSADASQINHECCYDTSLLEVEGDIQIEAVNDLPSNFDALL